MFGWFGGEEFVLLLLCMNFDEVMWVVDKVCDVIGSLLVDVEGVSVLVMVSVGGVCVKVGVLICDVFVNEVDVVFYCVKWFGCDWLVVYV